MKWINCKEQLPKEEGWYLIEERWSGVMNVRYFMADGKWFELTNWGSEVGCWMALPKSNYGHKRFPWLYELGKGEKG